MYEYLLIYDCGTSICRAFASLPTPITRDNIITLEEDLKKKENLPTAILTNFLLLNSKDA